MTISLSKIITKFKTKKNTYKRIYYHNHEIKRLNKKIKNRLIYLLFGEFFLFISSLFFSIIISISFFKNSKIVRNTKEFAFLEILIIFVVISALIMIFVFLLSDMNILLLLRRVNDINKKKLSEKQFFFSLIKLKEEKKYLGIYSIFSFLMFLFLFFVRQPMTIEIIIIFIFSYLAFSILFRLSALFPDRTTLAQYNLSNTTVIYKKGKPKLKRLKFTTHLYKQRLYFLKDIYKYILNKYFLVEDRSSHRIFIGIVGLLIYSIIVYYIYFNLNATIAYITEFLSYLLASMLFFTLFLKTMQVYKKIKYVNSL